jgi:hypothetical protein
VIALPVTRSGVYHNLKESKYVASNSEVAFFFSSEHTLNKFLNGYQKYREVYYKRNTSLSNTPFNHDMLSDIEFYKQTEKRGFCVWLKGVSINDLDLYYYGLRKMTQQNSPEWKRTERPRTVERFK